MGGNLAHKGFVKFKGKGPTGKQLHEVKKGKSKDIGSVANATPKIYYDYTISAVLSNNTPIKIDPRFIISV